MCLYKRSRRLPRGLTPGCVHTTVAQRQDTDIQAAQPTSMPTASDEAPVSLSRLFLVAARKGNGADEAAALSKLDEERLSQLDHSARLAFWLNVYNATVQYRLRSDPDQFDRRTFFSRSLIEVADAALSLDAIEHGILRRTQWKYGLGYVPNPLARGFQRRQRVDERDERIHFALNCGAASCPAVFGYDASRVDQQLDHASRSYLEDAVEYDPAAGRVTVPRLCLWYRGDFGGSRGIRRLLRRYNVIPDDASPSLSYAPYDWSLDLDAFAENGTQ